MIFCHPSIEKQFSDAIFTSLLHKGPEVDYTMHGFRSSFRDRGAEKTSHPRELLEVSLAHLPGDQPEQAYWRGDMIERRLALMEEWATYATADRSSPPRESRQRDSNGPEFRHDPSSPASQFATPVP